MAKSVRQQLNAYFSGIRDTKLLPRELLDRAASYMGTLAVEENRAMIIARLGRDGRPLPEPSPKYRTRKAKMIRGKLPRGERRTRYAATSPDDAGRLSGRLVLDIAYGKTRIRRGVHDIDLYVDIILKSPRSNKIHGYLQAKGFNMIGLAAAGTNLGRQQRKRILRAVNEYLKLGAKAKGVLLEDSK